MRNAFAALATTALVSSFAATAHADTTYVAGTASLGIGLGDPAALDLKLWTTPYSGFDFGIGLERFDTIFGVYGEYELGLVAFGLGDDGSRGVFYVGVGGALAFTEDKTSLAVIIPIGLDFRFGPPIDLFVEARPGIGVFHRPAFGIGGQVGVRYRF